MPPRHAYWTIILEGKPTAFRAHTSEELLPTFKQLEARHADIQMKWFARGQLWASQEDERARPARAARRPANGADQPGVPAASTKIRANVSRCRATKSAGSLPRNCTANARTASRRHAAMKAVRGPRATGRCRPDHAAIARATAGSPARRRSAAGIMVRGSKPARAPYGGPRSSGPRSGGGRPPAPTMPGPPGSGKFPTGPRAQDPGQAGPPRPRGSGDRPSGWRPPGPRGDRPSGSRPPGRAAATGHSGHEGPATGRQGRRAIRATDRSARGVAAIARQAHDRQHRGAVATGRPARDHQDRAVPVTVRPDHHAAAIDRRHRAAAGSSLRPARARAKEPQRSSIRPAARPGRSTSRAEAVRTTRRSPSRATWHRRSSFWTARAGTAQRRRTPVRTATRQGRSTSGAETVRPAQLRRPSFRPATRRRSTSAPRGGGDRPGGGRPFTPRPSGGRPPFRKPGGGGGGRGADGRDDRARHPVQAPDGPRARPSAPPSCARLTAAATGIPGLNRFRIGRRVRHGLPGYEQVMQQDFEFVVIIEVDDIDALKGYLSHPAHAAFGQHFTRSAAAALAYDYELVEADQAGLLVAGEGRDAALDRQRPKSARGDAAGAAKNVSMMSRSCGMLSAALIETRRCEPLSSPLVYHEFSARSLLMTHCSRPRAGSGSPARRRPGRARRAGSPAPRRPARLTSRSMYSSRKRARSSA